MGRKQMSVALDDFERVMEGVRQGSPEAVRELVDRCGPHILRIVRRQMHERIRSRFDSTDFVQSVWASFFAQTSGGVQFNDLDSLVRYLARMARNKVVEEVRDRMVSQKRNVNREHSLDGSAEFAAGQVMSRLPSPSQLAMAQETYDRLQDGLDPIEREIVCRLRQGHTHNEIAAELGVTTKKVQRLLHKMLLSDRYGNERGNVGGQPALGGSI
jgi:RNA polymerase sigma factor (sigma-70 family)